MISIVKLFEMEGQDESPAILKRKYLHYPAFSIP